MKLKTMVVTVEGKELTVGLLDPSGHPLYEIDGKEVGQDLAILRADLTKANGEAAERRIKLKEATDRLALFGDIDPEKAKTALETVANLDAGKLMDAGKVEELKKQVGQSYEANHKAVVESLNTQITDLTTQLSAKESSIQRMLVKGVFDTSEVLKETVFDSLRDSAYQTFGPAFVAEQGDNGDYRVVAKNPDGSTILSIARPGQPASPEEALRILIDNHPQKNHILKGSQAGGSGAPGGGGGGAKTTIQQLEEQLAAARKAGNHTLAIAITDQIHKQRMAAAA